MFEGFDWSWKPLKRRREGSDEFFEAGDLACSIARKQLVLDVNEVTRNRVAEFVCSVSRCTKSFTNVSSYEEHYHSAHRHVCGTCSRSFPSNRLLELHILESHDSMFQVLATKQSMYECLVEGCVEKFPRPAVRKDHLVRVHHYPASFRFTTKHTHKKSKRGKKDADSVESMQVETTVGAPNGDTEPMEEGGTERVSAAPKRVFTYRVPQNVTFGQGVSRGFQRRPRGRGRGKKGRHWHQQTPCGGEMETTVDIETVKMDDLASALVT